jgi:hypothetical protein
MSKNILLIFIRLGPSIWWKFVRFSGFSNHPYLFKLELYYHGYKEGAEDKLTYLFLRLNCGFQYNLCELELFLIFPDCVSQLSISMDEIIKL